MYNLLYTIHYILIMQNYLRINMYNLYLYNLYFIYSLHYCTYVYIYTYTHANTMKNVMIIFLIIYENYIMLLVFSLITVV